MYIERNAEDYSYEEKCLRCCVHSIIDDRVWVVGSYGQLKAVFSMNKELRDVRLEYDAEIGECFGFEQEYQEVYGYIKKKGRHIYLFPLWGYGIIDIDTISGTQNNYSFKSKYNIDMPYEPIAVIECGGSFYLVPGRIQHPLLKFDGTVVEECFGWKEQVQAIAMKKSGMLAFQCVFLKDKLYIPLPGDKKIICTDMETLRVSTYDLPPQSYCFERLYNYCGKFWLVPGGKGEVLSFSSETGIEERYAIPDTFKCSPCHTFTSSYFFDNMMWITPWEADEMLVLDLQTGNFDSLKLPQILLDNIFTTDVPIMETGFVDGHYLKLLACGGRYHCIIDMKERKFVDVIDSCIPENAFHKTSRAFSRRLSIWSYKYGTMEDFVSKIVRDNGVPEREKNNPLENNTNFGSVGTEVWNMLKERNK